MNAFGETMIMGHTVDMQVFYTDDPKAINDLAAFLMGEISTSERNPLMDTGNDLAMLLPLWCPFGKFGVLALDFSQGLLFLTKEARILDGFRVGERRKGFQSDIDANLLSTIRQTLWLPLHGKRSIPLARPAFTHSQRLDLAA